jgi:hypothetical protein
VHEQARTSTVPLLQNPLRDERTTIVLYDRAPGTGAKLDQVLEERGRVGHGQDAVPDVASVATKQRLAMRQEPEPCGGLVSEWNASIAPARERDPLFQDRLLGQISTVVDELLHHMTAKRIEADGEEGPAQLFRVGMGERSRAGFDAPGDEEVACEQSNSAGESYNPSSLSHTLDWPQKGTSHGD